MTKEDINVLWPDWRIEFVCDYACEKLRNLKGINFIYLRNKGWEEWGDGETFWVSITFENKVKNDFLTIDFHQDLFVEESLEFDKKTGADKMKDIRDKVIIRLAWHLKERWFGRN